MASAVSATNQWERVLVAQEVFKATVIGVEDGDSVVVKDPRETLRLHLDGIDAPELSQEFGAEAAALLRALAIGKVVTVRLTSRSPTGEESFGRLELDGADLSLALLRKGIAWYCLPYTEDRELARAEKEARESKRGLWNARDPAPPWRHRGTESCWQEKRGGSRHPAEADGRWRSRERPWVSRKRRRTLKASSYEPAAAENVPDDSGSA